MKTRGHISTQDLTHISVQENHYPLSLIYLGRNDNCYLKHHIDEAAVCHMNEPQSGVIHATLQIATKFSHEVSEPVHIFSWVWSYLQNPEQEQ